MSADLAEPDDHVLLSRYVQQKSEPAFGALVRRHVNHVFSAAWRRVNGDRALAEDVTQMVFTDLARKAAGLPPDVVLGGWLHRHTGFTASKAIDRDRRRRRREQEAATMTALHSTTDDPLWRDAAPLLDQALDQLPAADRDAVVLRFFQKHDFRQVGAALGVSDDTAQKRVARALEKLRAFLSRRGVTGTAGALSTVLATQAVTAAPTSLAGSVAGSALAGAAVSGIGLGGWWAALSAASRWKLAAALALVAAAAAAPVVLQQRELRRLNTENRTLRERAVQTPTATSPTATPNPAVSAAATDVTKPETPGDLIGQAAKVLRGGAQDITSTTQALALLARIPVKELQASLGHVAAVADEPAQALLYKYLISRWAETEPWQALQYTQTALPQQCRAGVFEGVLTAWAGRNPESALAWFQKSGGSAPPSMRESLLATIFRGLASRNLPKAVESLGWLERENERAEALRGLLEAVHAEGDRTQLLAALDTLKDEEARLQARRAVVEMWGQRDPAAAAVFVETVGNAWERMRLMDSLGLAWLQIDPEKASEWWIKQAPGPDTLIKIMNVWGHNDPNPAGAWLARQGSGPDSDPARMTFSRQVAELDPEIALRWAETITDPAQREATVVHVFQRWQARDAAAAQSFLQKTNWTPERVARLAPGRPQN
jgi:RNA polymerase sigma factor (sigma-70 family)